MDGIWNSFPRWKARMEWNEMKLVNISMTVCWPWNFMYIICILIGYYFLDVLIKLALCFGLKITFQFYINNKCIIYLNFFHFRFNVNDECDFGSHSIATLCERVLMLLILIYIFIYHFKMCLCNAQQPNRNEIKFHKQYGSAWERDNCLIYGFLIAWFCIWVNKSCGIAYMWRCICVYIGYT